MSDQAVKLEVKDRICTLMLNQPEKLNAMGDEMAKNFAEALEKIKADSEPRVVIVTGAGRAFSAGGNLDRIEARIGSNPNINQKNGYDFYNVFLRILELKIPTIAAINGHAIGAGGCLALACDMRYASIKSRIGFTFAKLGLHPGMGAEYFLSRIVGRARTFELLMTGDVITAEEACRIGLVNHTAQPEELMDKVMELAKKIAAMPVLPIKMLKESIDASIRGSLDDTLRREATYQALCYMGEDVQEGINAIREKRTPQFSDEY
ncbi:MAG: enoyl-CoA hydratase/isomerase family protein [Deltaproteobacteria bacterium]|nr:enoyl-CoA hydratase/isomerase family protein [Deltaproteobacteria bacterium]MBW2053103.1 enoyl-CoA hydratase/isomerase family protein [Deltaproteobacteria bacterium]MBW2141984.1 enoyl-CoA hydratase/isomerase family protein [Deltaproteobacteria bacterium]